MATWRGGLGSRACKTVLAVVLYFVFAGSAEAIMPPPRGVEFPQAVLAAREEIAAKSRTSGLASRLRQIKELRLQAEALGKPAIPQVVNVSVPVLLGRYSNIAHLFNAAQYQTLLFGANPTGSMHNYYDEVSYYQFNLTGTVYGPYTAANTQAYYVNGDYGFGTDYPTNAAGFIVSILAPADAAINFAQYDNDGPDGVANSGDDDGYVDALIVVFPDGDASGGDNDNIWAHCWELRWGAGASYTTNDAKFGGGFIKIDDYTIQGGEQGNGTLNIIKPIGVFCHEFGHILRLPDLYDSDNSSYGVGTWCLMGSGSWGANWNSTTEDTPVHMGAWCKVDLGWVVPSVPAGPMSMVLQPVEVSPAVIKLWEDAYQGGRFFLLENRIKSGFDQDIYGQGMLIWHCNEEVCFDNSVDNYRLVDLEEADGLNQLDTKASWMDAGDPYPGSTNKMVFNDASSPSARDVFGAVTGVSVSSIAYTAGPGSNVTGTVTPRTLDGFTISYHGHTTMWGWGYSTPQSNSGAVRFIMPDDGELFAVQAGVFKNTPEQYGASIYNTWAGGPSGYLTHTNGSFPSYPNNRYMEITLPSAIAMDAGEDFVVNVAWDYDDWAVPYTEYPSASGQSHFSPNGSFWYDWTDKDVLLRARVRFAACDCGVWGDVNADANINPMDVVVMVNKVYKSIDNRVQPPNCPREAGDVNCDDAVNPMDVVRYVNYVYKSITPWPCPDPCL